MSVNWAAVWAAQSPCYAKVGNHTRLQDAKVMQIDDQRISEEMKKGKDLKTALSAVVLDVKNDKSLPRITRELLTEGLL